MHTHFWGLLRQHSSTAARAGKALLGLLGTVMPQRRSLLHPALSWWQLLILIGALGLFAIQLLAASPSKSAAFDEQYHLTAGYSYLRTGDVRMATTHPPLMGMLAALPLLPRDDIVLPLDHPAWQAGDRFLYSDVFLWEANDDPQDMLLAARRPIMGVGVLLVLALYLWTRQLTGPDLSGQSALFVLLLAAFDPNLLGNARVVTTDLGLSCFLLLAMWRLGCWLERGARFDLAVAGVCAGLAISAKFTGLFFWPAAVLVLLFYPFIRVSDTWGRRVMGLFGMGLVALLVLWAVYGFSFGLVCSANCHLALPLPAPFYWQQLYNTFFRIIDLQGARYDFFWGEASNQGWWYYFPVALAVKTPLPLLFLSLFGLAVAVHRQGWRKSSILWVLPLLFLVLGLTGVLTIGYRHMLPVVPFLLIFSGYSADFGFRILGFRAGARGAVAPDVRREARDAPLNLKSKFPHGFIFRVALSGLLVWHILGSLRVYPHQESFFNELAGDWYNWSNLLVDSNLDWGQDLPALRDVMAGHDIEVVNLAYFGKAVPEVYGVRYRPLPGYLRFVDGVELNAYNPYTPEPGWYAISATSLRLGLHQADTIDLYAAFRGRRPDARAGYSIYLYKVVDPPDVIVDREVVAGQPVYQIEPETLGIEAGRRVQVKWVQGALQDARAGDEPTVFPLGEGFSSSASPGYQAVSANFDDIFTLLGYTQESPSAVSPAGQPLAFTFYWQVGQKPMPMPAPTKGAPIAVFVHLTRPGDPGQKIAQFDGWPTALRGLEPGDVIAQPVSLEISANTAAGMYDLLVGLYSPQSFGRLTVTNQPGAPDVVLAGQVAVR